MARVLVTSAGYRGDVLPFVSVARELAARGHEIDLVVPSGFHDSFAASTATSGIDQIWNAYRTAQLRAGLVLRRPSGPRTRRLVHQLVTARGLEENARDLAARLRPEHGAARAADAIEAALERRAS